MPIDDWQFWVVTGVALWRVGALIWKLKPSAAETGSPCGGCATGRNTCQTTDPAGKLYALGKGN